VFIIRSLFASKCLRFQVGWGCIDVERDVNIEMSDIRQSEITTRRSHVHAVENLSVEELEKQDII
jgi:hypothetical protein